MMRLVSTTCSLSLHLCDGDDKANTPTLGFPSACIVSCKSSKAYSFSSVGHDRTTLALTTLFFYWATENRTVNKYITGQLIISCRNTLYSFKTTDILKAFWYTKNRSALLILLLALSCLWVEQAQKSFLVQIDFIFFCHFVSKQQKVKFSSIKITLTKNNKHLAT